MIIQFKSAPELGRLRVVSDDVVNFVNGEKNVCQFCALEFAPICVTPQENGHFFDTKCLSRKIHFEQVKPNE